MDIQDNLEGVDVLVVDDIADSGITMKYVTEHIMKKSPASVRSCVLLDKPERRQVDFEADYIGFSIEDKFVKAGTVLIMETSTETSHMFSQSQMKTDK